MIVALTTALTRYLPWWYSIACILLFGILYFKYGREPDVDYSKSYETEPPQNYSPAILSALLNQDTQLPAYDAFGAVLMDLIKRRYVAADKNTTARSTGAFTNDDFVVTLSAKGKLFEQDKTLQEFEKEALRILFKYGANGATTLEEFKNKSVYDVGLAERLERWRRMVGTETYALGVLGTNEGLKRYYKLLISLIVIDAGIILYYFALTFLFGYPMDPMPATLIFLFTTLGAAALPRVFREALPRRTEKGALQYKQWMAFKHYLKEFGKLREIGLKNSASWENYIPYAIVLNERESVERVMLFKAKNSDAAINTILFGFGVRTRSDLEDVLEFVNALASIHKAIIVSVYTAPRREFGVSELKSNMIEKKLGY